MIDEGWVKSQFAAAKVSQTVGTSVLRLLAVWNTMKHSSEGEEQTLDVFGKIARGHALVPQASNSDGIWVDARPGQLVVGDVVRVRIDAFTGEIGTIHNGRVGRIVGIRSGDIIVKSIDDRQPELDGAHYSPHTLEKWIAK